MKFKELLEYPIYKTKDVDITLFHLFEVILILLVAWFLIWLISKLIKKTANRKNVEVGKAHAILQLAKYVLWIFAIILSLDTIGVKITLLLAGSAALLVGLGLGLQQLFQDFVSGIVLLFEGTIKVGDVVEIQDGVVGIVKEIGLRTSKIETRNNIILIVPNSRFMNDNVINWSHLDKKSRFYVNVGVAYGSNVSLVKDILIDCANIHNEVARSPKPFVMFADFGQSSLDFKLFFWTNNNFGVEIIKSDLRYMIDQKFRENKVQIPFPQRDVHIITPK